MLHSTVEDAQTLGADIRALRKARGLTLSELAENLDKSVGWMSQVERDISEPTLDDLRSLASALDVSVSSLLGTKTAANEEGLIVRKGNRRPIGSRERGVDEELLSPDLTDDFEVVHSTFEPKAAMTEALTRPTQEVGYIVSGRLELWINEVMFKLGPGDSFRIRGQSYRWRNPHSEPCVAIWVIAPPIY